MPVGVLAPHMRTLEGGRVCKIKFIFVTWEPMENFKTLANLLLAEK